MADTGGWCEHHFLAVNRSGYDRFDLENAQVGASRSVSRRIMNQRMPLGRRPYFFAIGAEIRFDGGW